MDAVLTRTTVEESDRSPWKLDWLVPVVLALLAFVSLWVDVPIVAVFEHKQLPTVLDRPLKEALEICEAFGHGFGAFLIAVAVGVLVPPKRHLLPWVFASSLGSGVVANLLKLTVHRTRPRDFDLLVGTVWDTFDIESSGGAGMQSFPSAHTATAVGLAVMLSSLFPQGRWFFLTMAFLVGMQRVVSSSHFPSDVFAGATVGWLVSMACVKAMRSANRPVGSTELTDVRSPHLHR